MKAGDKSTRHTKAWGGPTETSFLKGLALLTMVIDHIGKFFYPEVAAFQIIGRLAFPLFAWCLVVGSHYTSNSKQYGARLLLFALLSQPIYHLLFHDATSPHFTSLNILFTLFLGLVLVEGYKRNNFILISLPLVLAYLLPVDYGLWGLALIFTMNALKEGSLAFLMGVGIVLCIPFFTADYTIRIAGITIALQGFSVLSLPFLMPFWNYPKWTIPKYFFYVFYPGHLLVIYLMLRFF